MTSAFSRSRRYPACAVLILFLCFLDSRAAVPQASMLTVSPAASNVVAGATKQFTATAGGAAVSAAWFVNDIAGGNASVGTITTGGLYAAPAALPSSNPVTIRAANTADPMMYGVAQATVVYPTPVVQWFSPGKVPLGPTTFVVNGSNFYNGATVKLDGVALVTTYLSATQLRAASNVAMSSSGYITVTNPGPTAPTSAPRLIEFGEGIVVSISPNPVTVVTGTQQQFTATVTGTTNTQVYWYVNGGSARGTITSNGLYTAPATVPTGPVTIRAVSAINSERSATATVTVTAGQPSIQVSVAPASASVQTGATQQFTATVTGTPNTAVLWQVNGATGGSSSVGTISASGLYTAPAAVPSGSVTVRAVSQASSASWGTAAVTVTAAPVVISVTISPASATLQPGNSQLFTASVSGTANTAVTWQVNAVTGGSAGTGIISNSGLYTAPAAIPAASITVRAVSQADPSKSASASIAFVNPVSLSIGRFLEQSTFGPTPQLTAHVTQVGMQAFLDEQFNTPESVFPNGNATSGNEMMDQLYLHYMSGQDQLRQRVVHTLSEVIVISRNKNYYPNMLIPWLQILSRNAFGNYKNLLKEITLDASMGNFLDMVNSTKPGVAGGANENYPRELMQLFSIGLYELNSDGSQKLDANNQPIPTYTQNDVRQLALALTGWTFNRAGSTPTSPNPNYYPGPMVPLPAYHDPSSKTFLGRTLPANQTMQKDVDDAIDVIFNHPNVGPFVAVRMIRGLTSSNVSAGYVARVAAAFNDNGQGIRGDMKAVVQAVLMDPEARNDAPGPDFGKLRSPLLHHIALFRALGGSISTPSQITYVYDNMGESILNAPSVFGHYSPGYRIPRQSPPLFGPEFQIHGPGELINDGNFLWGFMSYYQTGIWDLQWLFNLGSDSTACINALDNLLLYGRMSAGMRQALQTALQAQAAAGADAKMRALTALYITAMSSEYLVMH